MERNGYCRLLNQEKNKEEREINREEHRETNREEHGEINRE